MPYRIKDYTKNRAKILGVEVRPSSVAGKKIDVFKNSKKIASVGALGYYDYPTFTEMEEKGKFPKGYAKQKRKLYKQRHDKDRKVYQSRGYWADQLLW